MELIEAKYDTTIGPYTITAVNYRSFEEFLEMAGILLINYSLMKYVKENFKKMILVFQ